jgi:hypothetical protein
MTPLNPIITSSSMLKQGIISLFTGEFKLETLSIILQNKSLNLLLKQVIIIEQAAQAIWYFNQN